MTTPTRVEDLLRELAPQALGALVRRYGRFDIAEDAVQEALIAAAQQWPETGTPDNPRGWLIRIASRRLIDERRSAEARRRREESVAATTPRDEFTAPPPGAARAPSVDDTLTLLFLCCHSALTPASQIALTLRAVGGLTTAEIARAFLVPAATMAQRISRAKATIKTAGARFRMPEPAELPKRFPAVLHVLYLIFTEGYSATSGIEVHRAALSAEAIRLTRIVHTLLPDNAEVAGLLALMLLVDARRPARVGPGGELIPLAEQDRSRWHRAAIDEGVALISAALPRGRVGPYQIQAAIAAVHDEAASHKETDWIEILGLYELLMRVSPSPVVSLNHAVAVAMVYGPEAGLARLTTLDTDGVLAETHRVDAARAHLLEMAGDVEDALAAYQRAAARTLNVPERRYLQLKAAALRPPSK